MANLKEVGKENYENTEGLEVDFTTEKAYFFRRIADEKTCWVPKSQTIVLPNGDIRVRRGLLALKFRQGEITANKGGN